MEYQVGVGEPWSRLGALVSKVKKYGISGKSPGLNLFFKSGLGWEEFHRKVSMGREVSSLKVRSPGGRWGQLGPRKGWEEQI